MQRQLITTYLDSSDYSALSDPSISTAELRETRRSLLAFAQSGQVRFAFSAAHLSEIAPLASRHTAAATARADLLVELCGKNALISFDRLIEQELSRLSNPALPEVEAVTSDATWFPLVTDLISPVRWLDTAKEIDQASKEQGLNRHARRKLRRTLFKRNHPTPMMRRWLDEQSGLPAVPEIIKEYPMRPEDAHVFSQYFLGRASSKEAEEAFLASLRDPRWMMRWFEKHHSQMNPVIQWVRGPARDLIARLQTIADQALVNRAKDENAGRQEEVFSYSQWQAAQNDLVTSVAAHLLQQRGLDILGDPPSSLVDRMCPGLCTALRSLHDAIWDAIGSRPRTLQPSDFVDAIHSMYAPYVDIFRADRYMAHHIRKHTSSHHVCVVSRLSALPAQIEQAMKRNNSE